MMQRMLFKEYIRYVRRHWIYFLLVIVGVAIATWIVLEIGRSASRMPGT